MVLDQGSLLRVVSWNIDFMAAGRAKRASSAMDHLEEAFEDPPLPLVIMLQEVHCESLLAILEHPWIRKNFVLSDVSAPQSYFTLMMVSRRIQSENWFRVPLQSRMKRDILAVDIPISHSGSESAGPKKILRLCTTHLESLWEPEGEELRPHQLAQISALLKAPPTCVTQIIGGLVGGDMNHISPLDSASHKTGNVELYDVWEDTALPPIPPRKPFQKDLTFGRAKANTWGYQSQGAKSRKRLDKFFYTGSVDTIALAEVQDLTGKIGRLGIGLKTKVEVWEDKRTRLHLDKKRFLDGMYCSDGSSEGVFKEVDAWVSDHFGIAIGIRVR
jgi:tyrosyl-DNA phosphodiesterase 2